MNFNDKIVKRAKFSKPTKSLCKFYEIRRDFLDIISVFCVINNCF